MKKIAALLATLLLATPLVAAVVGVPTHGIIGVPITTITGDGTTTPWVSRSGIYAFQCWGTFDGAEVKLQWELSPGAGFVDMPNTTGPYTTVAACVEGRIQLYNGTSVQVDISSSGGSTDLSVVLRGPRSRE